MRGKTTHAIMRRAFGCALLLCVSAAPLLAQDGAEIILRLDRLEAENRRLNGQAEELRFQIRRLEEQVKRLETDADLRFRDLEGNRSGARPAAPQSSAQTTIAPGAAPPGIGAPGSAAPAGTPRRSDAFDPAATPNAPGTPRQLGTTPPSPPTASAPLPLPGAAPQQGGRDLDPLGAPLDVTGRRPPVPAPVAGQGDAASDFAYAKSLVDRGDYELSEGAFRDFLRTHGKDRRAAEATFFLGEGFLRRTRYREAAEQFLTVTSKFPNAPRAPEAMLKLGISLRGLNANEEACGTFAQVARKYPNASAAIKQAVERERARAQC